MSLEQPTIHIAEAMDRLMGGHRSEQQIRIDGARTCLAQINVLRRKLDLLERSVRHVANTGQEQKADNARWKSAARAADTLFDGMVETPPHDPQTKEDRHA